MKQLKIIAFVLCGLLLATAAQAASRNLKVVASNAQAQNRVALVIGNAKYQGAPPLRNPVNDAHAMSNALNALGFEVIEVTDATQKEMNRAITAFGSKLNAETAALFFYAGHGLQVRGKNYIIPVDAQIEAEAAVTTEAVSVDAVLEQLNASPVSIVILDACRNNPFERSFRKMGGSGLAQMDAPKGSFIAYATAPGKTAIDGEGKNGLFTQELLKHINDTGVELSKLFMRVRASVAEKSGDAQMPWDSSSMVGEFYFKPGKDSQVVSLEPVAAPVGGGVSLEDIKKQQKAKGKWDKWQSKMKADFDQIVALNAPPDLQVTAWDRFLTSYTEKNPFSAEDDSLREQARNNKQNAENQKQHVIEQLVTSQSASNVNGVTIPQERIDLRVKMVTAQQGQKDTPELRKAIREDLVNIELMSQEALKKELEKQSETVQQLELAKQTVLVGAFVQDFVKSHPVNNVSDPEQVKRLQQMRVKDLITELRSKAGNNISIPQERIDLRVKMVTAQQGQKDTPELRKAIREDLVNIELMSQEALKKELEKQSETVQQLELAKQSVLVGAFVQDFVKFHPVSDEDIAKEYDKLKITLGNKEYNVRHILVEKESEAESIAGKLRMGDNFDQLAKINSKDAGSKEHGGDLGWIPVGNIPNTFVKPFGDAVMNLAKGQISGPVQSQFGWHIIKLEDVRVLKIPPLDKIKTQITQRLQQQRVKDMIADLRSKATIN